MYRCSRPRSSLPAAAQAKGAGGCPVPPPSEARGFSLERARPPGLPLPPPAEAERGGGGGCSTKLEGSEAPPSRG